MFDNASIELNNPVASFRRKSFGFIPGDAFDFDIIVNVDLVAVFP
jgi:hypothetical protein